MGPSSRVIEAGSGSGGISTVSAVLVGDEGYSYSFDVIEDMVDPALSSLYWAGLSIRVKLNLQDIIEGFEQEDVDAAHL